MIYPILYTFRRCPYAIRARMALYYAQIRIQQIEVDLRNKPLALLEVSSKATVPVLVVNSELILTESMDIIYWALKHHDPDHWLNHSNEEQTQKLIDANDRQFKPILDAYKYSHNREPQSLELYRTQAQSYLSTLNELLSRNTFLLGSGMGLLDCALMPFIRQFYMVDTLWFEQSGYGHLQQWLDGLIESDLFRAAMVKPVTD